MSNPQEISLMFNVNYPEEKPLIIQVEVLFVNSPRKGHNISCDVVADGPESHGSLVTKIVATGNFPPEIDPILKYAKIAGMLTRLGDALMDPEMVKRITASRDD